MLIYLLRHGETQYNVEKRYQGIRDIPLSDKGRQELHQADISPRKVFTSSLCRTMQTAEILFPQSVIIPVPELREMCFGVFQGRNFGELEHDADYSSWLEGGCVGRCPEGESRAEFCERTCNAFVRLVDMAEQDGEEQLVIVAHGGTQMAIMERYASPEQDYYRWCAGNGAGYLLDTGRWSCDGKLDLVDEVCFSSNSTVGESFFSSLGQK